MKEGFLKLVKNQRSDKLRQDPNAFMILMEVAHRANRHASINELGLEQYQAVIGRTDFPYLTEKVYRGAKRRLERGGYAIFKGRRAGTIATLCNSWVWDINPDAKGQVKGEPMVMFGQTLGKKGATNKNTRKEVRKEIIDIVEFLNKTCEKSFQYTTTETQKVINARLKDYSVEDLKRVITLKAKQWKGDPKMDRCLKPDTLFRPSNFEAYLQEKDNLIDMHSNDPNNLQKFLEENRRKLSHG